MINVCVPTLKRYDLLEQLVLSLEQSSIRPVIHIINNGRDAHRFGEWIGSYQINVFTPDVPLSVAESWNWFIRNVPEDRIISNDDVTFAPDSLQKIVDTPGDFVSPLPGQAYSCYLLRDSCVEKVGFFDEAISPGYAYFEDCDYSERMIEAGFAITHVEDCGVIHAGSQTLATRKTDEEMKEHHRRFLIAQGNFLKKWGHMPEGKVQQYG